MKTKVVDAPAGEGIQYLTDENGKRLAVILTMEAWEELLTRLEDAEDIADAEQASAAGELGDIVPWEALLSRLEDLEDAFELSEAIRTDDASEGAPLAQVRAELGL